MRRLLTWTFFASFVIALSACSATRQRIAFSSELESVRDERVRTVRLVDSSLVTFADDGAFVQTTPSVAIVGVTTTGDTATIDASRVATADLESSTMSWPFFWTMLGVVTSFLLLASSVGG
ncbi:MAG: hypothetical protein H7X80_11605 [bacterium]|nr:hypothetical protein [Candidatus Kapabacteria bacterium]